MEHHYAIVQQMAGRVVLDHPHDAADELHERREIPEDAEDGCYRQERMVEPLSEFADLDDHVDLVVFKLLHHAVIGGAVLAGMAGRVLYPGLVDQETILPVLSSELFPAFITGIFIAIVLAAIISTVDSLLILLSSAVVRDVYQKVFRPDASQDKIVFLGKLVTVIIGLSAFMFSLTENRLIFWFVLFAWAGIGSAFCPVIILSLFWKRITKAGAIAGMIGGFTVAMVWVIFLSASTGLYEMIPGFVCSFLIAYLVSLFTQPPANAANDLENVVETVNNYTV